MNVNEEIALSTNEEIIDLTTEEAATVQGGRKWWSNFVIGTGFLFGGGGRR